MESNSKKAKLLESSCGETLGDFTSYLATAVRGGYISMAVSVGMETGVLQVLCGLSEPRTAQEITDLAGLKERYVREWLRSMVTARIVEIKEYDEDQEDTFYIPSHRIPALQPDSGQSGTAMHMRTVPSLSAVHKDLAQCFKKDGPNGIPFNRYSDYEESVTAIRIAWFDAHLIKDFIPTVVGLHERLDSGINVLDLGSWNGAAVNLLAETYPKSHIYGIDISQEYVVKAEKSAREKGLKNTVHLCRDAAKIEDSWTAKFQYVFISDALHDFARADKVLQEVYRVLTPDGQVSVIDTYSHSKLSQNFAQRDALLVRHISSLMYCLPLSLSVEGSLGLGGTWGMEEVVKLLEDCGFESSLKSTPGRKGLHYLCKKKTL